MSATVADFMKKNVQKYACGPEAQRAKGVLLKAFTSSEERRKPQETALFEAVLDAVMQTKKGRETLISLSDLGYSFAFEKGNFGGFCAPNRKKIVINPSFSFDYMARTVVHEGRHALQYSSENPRRPNLEHTTVASMLRMKRAIEADAVAHEMAFVYECKDILPDVFKKCQAEGLPMFQAYVGEMKKSGDEKKAMQAGFSAWYECAYYRNYYDNWHKDTIKKVCEYGKSRKDPACFSKEYPVGDVIKMCLFEGKPYMTAEALTSGKPFSITQLDRSDISLMVANYAAAVPGARADKSVLSMNIRNSKGDLLSSVNKSAALSAAMTQKGR